MMRKIILLYLLSTSANLFAQQFLSNFYSGKVYKADQKMWDAKEDKRGRIWFANNDGVIRFDGSNWVTFKTPNPARHLAFSGNGDLYIACLGDFGILEFNPDGTTEYVSLFNQDSLSDKATGGNENVFIVGEDIFFYMRNHLVLVKKNPDSYKITILQSIGETVGAFVDGKDLYVNSITKGLGLIRNGNFQPCPNGKFLMKYDIIKGIHTAKGTSIITNFDGVFNYEGSFFSIPKTELSSFAKLGTTECCMLSDEKWVVGTLHNGVKIFNKDGKENSTLQLPSNEIYSIYADAGGNLWIGHAKGLSHVLLNVPIKSFPNINFNGYATDMVLVKNLLYVSTTSGVYTVNIENPNITTTVTGISDECWDLYAEKGIVLVATTGGLYSISGDKVELLTGKETFTNIQKGNRTGLIYTFSTSGCWKYRIGDKGVTLEGKLDRLKQLASSIYENPDGTAWIGTYLNGLLKYPELKSTEMNELRSGKVFVKVKDGKPLFQKQNSIYTLVDSGFQLDKELSQTYGGAQNKDNVFGNDVWIFTENRIKHIVNSKLVEQSAAYSVSGKPTAVCYDGKTLWMAFEENIFRMYHEGPVTDNLKVAINMVVYGGDKVAHSGEYVDDQGNQVLEQSTIPQIDHDNNSIRIEFGISSFINPDGNNYRYKLDGLFEDWSEWQKEGYIELKGLTGGLYTLHVQGKNANGEESKEIVYQFRVLNPWYLRWWAVVAYIALLVLAIYIFLKIYNKRLVNANERLEKVVNDRTAELSHSIETLKTTQEQLVQNEKLAALGQMTAGIAHEIQNPLNFVTNFSQISQNLITELNETHDELERKEIGKDLVNNLSKINEHGQRASMIVKNMLEHSRKGSGAKQLVSINEICSEYINLAFQSAKANSPEFECDIVQNLEPSNPRINVVQKDIGRVVLNLLSNAFYAVEEKQNHSDSSYKPSVTLSTQVEGKNIIVKIKDNGMGIPSKTKVKIFEPFFSTKPSGSGTGLGLSMSYDIIKAHLGEIKVESEEGNYTEFTISIPKQ